MPSRADGSTYLLALVSLLVLSLLGGALLLLHQTERSAAGNQVGFTKTLYAAESAVGLALARTLILGRSEPFVLLRDLRWPRDGALASLSEVEVQRFEGSVAFGAGCRCRERRYSRSSSTRRLGSSE